jgi:hypothetical protein
MGVIKTALEIALERTENVKSDKSSIGQYEARQYGKKLANAFLVDNSLDITSELKKIPTENIKNIKQGIFDIFITQIALPDNKEDEKKIEKLGKGLAAIINLKEFSEMFAQLALVFSQYVQEKTKYEQVIQQQYAPKLRQKEEELSRRLGREVRIDPLQDPEFVSFLSQHMNALKSNYEPIVEQAKEETRSMFEKA